jgi:predicted lysophospholipase L1 biosynthesis ABC-type transport system permease subunit
MVMTRSVRITIVVFVFLIALCVGVFAGAYVLRHVRILPYVPHVSVWLDRVTLVVMVVGIPVLATMITYRLLGKKSVPKGKDM